MLMGGGAGDSVDDYVARQVGGVSTFDHSHRHAFAAHSTLSRTSTLTLIQILVALHAFQDFLLACYRMRIEELRRHRGDAVFVEV